MNSQETREKGEELVKGESEVRRSEKNSSFLHLRNRVKNPKSLLQDWESDW